MYPSILGKTSAICFLEWPEEALRHIAVQHISKSGIPETENVFL